jgi:hypothetical protein
MRTGPLLLLLNPLRICVQRPPYALLLLALRREDRRLTCRRRHLKVLKFRLTSCISLNAYCEILLDVRPNSHPRVSHFPTPGSRTEEAAFTQEAIRLSSIGQRGPAGSSNSPTPPSYTAIAPPTRIAVRAEDAGVSLGDVDVLPPLYQPAWNRAR